MSDTFSGFHPQLFQFLSELKNNNQRDWFQANKERYETEVLNPALAFVRAMEAPLAKISPHFTAIAKRQGGSVMRIYRDTRFGHDKTPYKTNVGIQFRHERGKDVHAPGFYLHLSVDECFFGLGIWRPDCPTLKRIRTTIAADVPGWKRAIGGKAFQRDFQLSGESLKRAPRGFDADHPLIDDLKRKDFIAITELDFEELFDPGLTKHLARLMRNGRPLMQFLCGAIGVEYDSNS